MFKKLITIALIVCTTIGLRADEGMWLPILLDKKYSDMVRKGLKMTPEMIYSVNHSSLKDAIIQFGGGCTGEIISNQGLILTNHHCGYSYIAGTSDVEHNYLKNGYWAKNMKEEIPIPGLTAKFLVRMEDVTDRVMSALPKKSRKPGDEEFDKAFAEISKTIVDENIANTNYVAEVKPLYNGNQYFLWVYQIFTDIRFVAAPPESLGKFGGDIDNWEWPRHTADFSMFRIYADKNNEPAPYAKDNKPYKPLKSLNVSIAGMEEGDYAMILGYPGRTDRYMTSYGVKTAIKYVNPSIVKLRGQRLNIMKEEMIKDPAVKLKLASRYAQIANYWKYFIGQTEQLERFDVIDKKKKEEEKYKAWAKSKGKYDNIYAKMLDEEKKYREVIPAYYYYNEGLFTPTMTLVGYTFQKLIHSFTEKDTVDVAKLNDALRASYRSYMSQYDSTIDPQIFAQMFYTFQEDMDPEFYPLSMNVLLEGNSDVSLDYCTAIADSLYGHSSLMDSDRVMEMIDNEQYDLLLMDPMVVYSAGLQEVYETKVKKPVLESREVQAAQAKDYLHGLLEYMDARGVIYYPDANSTMRLTYGEVKPYSPRDAVFYDYYTTLEGLVEKYQPGDYEFDVPDKILKLYKEKDYGRYAANDGKLHLCFLTTNDITGGNSGSPVLNGSGDLIGLAFDGNWEAMCGDIYYDDNYKRTINVDTRYILWLIEKYGNAPNLISEMNVIEAYPDN